VNRALQLTWKYWEGRVPRRGELTEVDRVALAELRDVKERVEQLLEQFKFRDAQFEAMNLARIGNRYITECEPWKVWKQDQARCETILNICLQLTANLAIAFEPFLPFSSRKLRQMLNIGSFDIPEQSSPTRSLWEQLGSTDLLPDGHQLGQPSLLFEKIDDDAIQRQLDKLERMKTTPKASPSPSEGGDVQIHNASGNAASLSNQTSPPSERLRVGELCSGMGLGEAPIVDFETFEKLDIRVGLVKECQAVKKSKKLLQFTIDDGTGTDRTICSGIAQFYDEPERLVGQRVLFVANFAPRRMMGIESQGMILSAVDADGSLSLVTTTKDVRPGSQVG